MMRLIDLRIGVQLRVIYDAVALPALRTSGQTTVLMTPSKQRATTSKKEAATVLHRSHSFCLTKGKQFHKVTKRVDMIPRAVQTLRSC